MGFRIDPPPGGAQKELTQVYSYLYQMHEQLNTALNSLTAENFAGETAETIAALDSGEMTRAAAKQLAQQEQTLRSLIIKTADTVEAQMQELSTELAGSYVAKSEFGTYQETARNELAATANGIVQNFTWTGQATPLKEGMTSFSSYVQKTQSYIITGLIDVEGGVPVYGVAVGDSLSTTETVLDGQTVRIVNAQNQSARFTKNELSFWNEAVKVAWLSNTTLHITNAEIRQAITIGEAQGTVEASGVIAWRYKGGSNGGN